MYFTAVNRQPAPGHEAELRGILTELAHHLQSLGYAVELSETIWRREGPMFFMSGPSDPLGEWEATVAQLRADAPYQTLIARIAPLLQQPAGNLLLERLVAPLSQPSDAPIRRRVSYYPAAGHGREVEGLLVAYVQQRQADGATTLALARTRLVAGGDYLSIFERHRDLAAVDAAWHTLPASARAMDARVGPLCRTPPDGALTRILVPAPN